MKLADHALSVSHSRGGAPSRCLKAFASEEPLENLSSAAISFTGWPERIIDAARLIRQSVRHAAGVLPVTDLNASAKALRDIPATTAIFESDQSSLGD